MQENHNFNMQDLIRIANSPAGQRLMDLLQSNGGSALQQAMAEAAAGDYRQAKAMLNSLLKDPEAKSLLEQLGR